MPCYECPDGKWRIKEGKCKYETKKDCEDAVAAIHAQDGKTIAFLEKIGARIQDYHDHEIN